MTSKRANSRLSRPAALVLHAVLVSYICEEYGFKHGVATQVENDIYSTDDDSLDKIIAFNYDGEFARITDALQSFIYRMRSPMKYKADIYEAFLIAKGYLHKGDLERFSKISFDEMESIPYYKNILENYDKEEGIFFHEGNADRETLISSIMLMNRPKERVLLAYVQERVYRKQDGESGADYKERIDNAKSNIYRDYHGYLLGNELVLYEAQNNEYEYGSKRDAYKNKENVLIVTTRDDQICRAFKNTNLRPPPKGKKKVDLGHSLTERERNHIITEFSPSATQKMHCRLEPSMRNYVRNAQDKHLLKAAENGDAIEMILAISDGADINAQDPATGWTALHWVARLGNPLCLAVMCYEPDVLADMYEFLKSKGYENITKIDLKLRACKDRVNPLILCNEHLFASEKSILGKNVFETAVNPYLIQQEKVHLGILSLESTALAARNLPVMLCAYPPEERPQILNYVDGKGDKKKILRAK